MKVVTKGEDISKEEVAGKEEVAKNDVKKDL